MALDFFWLLLAESGMALRPLDSGRLVLLLFLVGRSLACKCVLEVVLVSEVHACCLVGLRHCSVSGSGKWFRVLLNLGIRVQTTPEWGMQNCDMILLMNLQRLA